MYLCELFRQQMSKNRHPDKDLYDNLLMKTTRLIVTLYAMLAVAGIGMARKYNPDAVLPQLLLQLRQASTPGDSVKILYDIYDISPRSAKLSVGRKLYEVAGRAKDENAQLDIMRQNSNLYSANEDFVRLRKQVQSLPRTEEQIETDLFLQMRQLSHSTRRPDSDTPQEIAAIINKLNVTPADKMSDNDRLLNIYTVAAFMRNVPDSKLLEEYVDSMVNLVNHNNYRLYALRNLIYSEAANIYSDAGQTKKAVEANREMLKIISGLEEKYGKAGRKYRDYDVSRYIVYRRLLRNYKGLTPAEAEDYYNKIQQLAASNSDVAADMQRNPSPLAYYYMAKGHYTEAIPLLKNLLEHDRTFPTTRQLHAMLQTAARETGDSVTLISSLEAMNRLNMELEATHLAERYRELQVAYEVNTMEADQYKERVRNAEAESARLRSNFSYNMLIWLLFVILLTVLLFYWTRYRSNIARLRRIADNMSDQRDRLKADRYNEYETIPYKERVSRVNSNDTQVLIKSIMTSVLYTAAIGHDERNRHIVKTSASKILHKIDEGIRPHLLEKTDLQITCPATDIDMTTDISSVTYVLERIIMFAQSRSSDGIVTLTANHVGESQMVQFIFTHNGARIPAGHEETLFDYIIDMDELRDRDDSSMLLCSLVALLLQCTVAYNPHVDGPAKLILNIPKRLNV